MNLLKKAFLSAKSIKIPIIIRDMYAQLYVFSAIPLLFAGLFDGVFAVIPLAPLLIAHAYSFLQNKKTLFQICTLLSILYLMLVCVMLVLGAVRDEEFASYEVVFVVLGITLSFSNSFFWHFQRKMENFEDSLFRIFVLLEISFLLFPIISILFWFFEKGNLFFLFVFEFCTLLYIGWQIVRPQVQNEDTFQNKDKTTQKTTDILKNKYITLTSNWKTEFENLALFQLCFILFFVIYSLFVIGIFNDTSKQVEYHLAYSDVEMPPMTGFFPISIGALLYCIVWAASLLANPEGKGALIGTAISVMTGIPILVYMFFKAVLLF